jgi:hypothetical protein
MKTDKSSGRGVADCCWRLAPFNGTHGILNPEIRFVHSVDETWQIWRRLVLAENTTDKRLTALPSHYSPRSEQIFTGYFLKAKVFSRGGGKRRASAVNRAWQDVRSAWPDFQSAALTAKKITHRRQLPRWCGGAV